MSAGEGVRLVSWNVSSDAFVRDPASFRALLTRADADLLLFDEVGPATTEAQLRAALAGRRRDGSNEWHISVGRSGGRQRGVIVSRQPLERVPELSEIVPYPAAERDRLHNRMVAANADQPGASMDGGIPVNGAFVTTGARRLLVVVVDLQCCGGDPASWEETISGSSDIRIPEIVCVSALADVRAGFANDVLAVNEFAAKIQAASSAGCAAGR